MEKILELILVLVIVGSVLAFGGVQPLTIGLVEVLLFSAILVLVMKQTRQGKIRLPLPVWPLLLVLWVVLQVISLPWWLVVRVSPGRLEGLDVGGASSVPFAWTTLSIYPHDTVLAGIKLLAYLCAFVLAAYLFDSRHGRSRLVGALIFIGSFEAAYGIVQYLTGWHKIFTYAKQYDLHEATGTYINRNHFAGLLELTVPFVAAWIFYYFQIWSERREGVRERGVRGSAAGYQLVFYLFLLVLMAVAVVFSRSRTGILAMVFSLVFIALLAQFKTRRKVWALGVFVFLLGVVGYGLWIGLDPVLARFERMGEVGYLETEGRIAAWGDSLRLVRDYPWTGTGLGTFGIAFRRYQTTRVDYFFDHAHNDYLEFASELGLLGVGLLFVPVLYLLVRMIASFLSDPRRHRRAITLGCIGSTLALLLHSLTDFNLQIPANALIFAVVLAMGYKATCLERREEARGIPPLPTP